MAKWILFENRDQYLTLLYRNLTTGVTVPCGQLRPDTPSSMIVAWIMNQDAARPGDIIKFQDGTVVQVLPQVAIA
jgi:hypothetical protein